MSAFLEKCQKSICMHGCSQIHVEVLIIVGISWSPDLRVQYIGSLVQMTLFGRPKLRCTSVNLDDRPFGQSKITVEEHNFGSLSKWTADIHKFGHSPFLQCGAIHLDGSKIMYIYL